MCFFQTIVLIGSADTSHLDFIPFRYARCKTFFIERGLMSYVQYKTFASQIVCLATIRSSIRYLWRLLSRCSLFPTYAISTNYIYNDKIKRKTMYLHSTIVPCLFVDLWIVFPKNSFFQGICYKNFNRSPAIPSLFKSVFENTKHLIR